MDNPESLMQLGVSAAIAGWLVRWMTTMQQRSLDRNTSALLNLQLYVGELYRLILVTDANNRGLDLSESEDLTAHHKDAMTHYKSVIDRLDSIKETLQKTLDSL